ncbi:MAG: GLPGLI family protein [Staphylococcus sp.]|nr:GLPGLI family protein [Staphylococcus sp.]
MKTKVLTIILFALAFCGFALPSEDSAPNEARRKAMYGNQEVIGRSYMECIYEHASHDPVLNETRYTDGILQIGKNVSIYRLYLTYQRDSVVISRNYDVSREEFSKLSKKYSAKNNMLVKNFADKTLSVHYTIPFDKYTYTEVIPQMDWTLSDETDEIAGYRCGKATVDFRGRKWTAWYSEDIAVDNGPWKFNGLPGLIIKVEDDKKEHVYQMIQLRKSDSEIFRIHSSSEIKTDRMNFNKALKDYCMSPPNFIVGHPLVPKNADGSALMAPKRVFYSPLEKE